tara:strand:+ start:5544 stop:6113 length:570 start_codon:yes stop_codon:yes gene_type:complete
MEKYPHLMDERIQHEIMAFGQPKAKKLSVRYFTALVGADLAKEAYDEIHLADRWKHTIMPFVVDPTMTSAQKAIWDALQPHWAGAIRQARRDRPVRAKFKEAYDNIVVQMLKMDGLTAEEKRLFFDDTLPDRVVPEVGWHPRLLMRTYKQSVVEPPWIREAPIFQQRAALTKALQARLARKVDDEEGQP